MYICTGNIPYIEIEPPYPHITEYFSEALLEHTLFRSTVRHSIQSTLKGLWNTLEHSLWGLYLDGRSIHYLKLGDTHAL